MVDLFGRSCFHFGIDASLHRSLEFSHGGFARVRLARAEWFDPGTAIADALSHSQEPGSFCERAR